jgi:hypothetical protein
MTPPGSFMFGVMRQYPVAALVAYALVRAASRLVSMPVPG